MLAEQFPVERMDMRGRAVLPEAQPVAQSAAPPYRVGCPTCHASFDTAEAEWCHCVTSERTLVCPSCDTCFCKAGLYYSRQFWAGAPRTLRMARNFQHSLEAVAFMEPQPGPRNRPLVLLVDDEGVIRHLATHVISRLGYEVIVAANGADGLEMARRFRPDIVLTDALMPKMDGRDMCRAIKSDPETAHIKVLLMTSLYTSVRYKNEGFKTYLADGYLAKPLDRAQVARVLAEHVPAEKGVAAGRP
jgi:CheY-like chemotaxis protein